MKYIVLSDTHGDISLAEEIIDSLKEEIDGVIHLGDMDKDAIELRRRCPGLDFHYIKGNNERLTNTPEEKEVSLGGWNVYMVHGHKHGVYYSFMRLLYGAEEKGADVVLFGHTHTPWLSREGRVLMLNPGSLVLPRGERRKTFGILELREDKMPSAEIYEYVSEDVFKPIKI